MVEGNFSIFLFVFCMCTRHFLLFTLMGALESGENEKIDCRPRLHQGDVGFAMTQTQQKRVITRSVSDAVIQILLKK